MANTISILIQAKDQASTVLGNVGRAVDQTTKKTDEQARQTASAGQQWTAYATAAAGAGVATHSLFGILTDSKNASFRLEAALTGLNSVARAFGQDADAAKKAARDLAKDGLMPVSDAATSLKNLLAAGFNLDQAVTLLNRFRDSAAFGRQGALSFGEAIRGATEGIKNGNSILVDNAGVTKNLSMMLEDAGYSAQDLMRASSDAGVRQAIFNGILKETNPQLGDAARLADSAAGAEARMAASAETASAKFGQALQPAIATFYETLTPLVTKLGEWIEQNPKVASTLLLVAIGVTGLIAVLGTLGLAISALGPLWAGMAATATGSLAAVKLAYTGLAALIATPLIMPAIAVAAALASIATVYAKGKETLDLLDRMNEGAKTSQDSQTAAEQQVRTKYKQGLITKEAHDNFFRKMARQGYSDGGYTGAGSRSEVAGVVHRGEYVVPAKDVDQSTGTPKSSMGGSVIVQQLNVNNNVDVGLVIRQMGWALATR